MLKYTLQTNPTLTILRDHSQATEIQFDNLPKSKEGRDIPLPDNFDARIIWKGLISPVRNQGKCGSCWAFASVSTLADRFNIQSLGLIKLELSPAKLILCDFMGKEYDIEHPEKESDMKKLDYTNSDALSQGACHGNTLYDAWRYLYVIGTNTESCVPYDKTLGDTFTYDSLSSFSKTDQIPFCTNITGEIGDMCANQAVDRFSGDEYGNPARFFRAYHIYSVAGTEDDGGSERNIRHNIFTWGPVSTGIVIYPDFYTFDPKNEIYEWNGKGEPVGGHAVEIVGWGRDKKDYWLIKNSWGVDWGDDGYFKMLRGKNMCKIEENIVTGVPDFFYPELYHLHNPSNFIWAEKKKDQDERRSIDTDFRITGGGIDSTTGYTRRIMISKPWIELSPPIDYKLLPDWNYFIAGIDASPKNRYKYQRLIRGKHPKIKIHNESFYLTMISLGILIGFLIILK